jgi:hypothetical protein
MTDSTGGSLTPEPLERRAASLIATFHPQQLWVLDRLVCVHESRFQENQGRGPAAPPSVAELFWLACTFLEMWWGAILARAKDRLHARLYQLGLIARHRSHIGSDGFARHENRGSLIKWQ